MKIIVSSHSNLAYGLRETLLFIGSDISNIEFIVLDNQGVQDFEERVKKVFDKIFDEEVLVFTDIFGGTPYNVFAKEILQRKIKGEIISGFNVTMIIHALSVDTISEMLEELKEDNGIKIYSEELKNICDFDDE